MLDSCFGCIYLRRARTPGLFNCEFYEMGKGETPVEEEDGCKVSAVTE